MQPKYAPVVAALLVMSSAAFAQEEDKWKVSGSLGAGLRATDIDGGRRNAASSNRTNCLSTDVVPCFAAPVPFDSIDKAKASEYRDLDSGFIGYVDVQAQSFRNYVKFFGENFGRDDQLLRLQGGTYGRTKFEVYEDKMPHNLSWNALTPMTGTGGSVLGGTRSTDASTWNSFDYSLERANRGFKAEFTAGGPWHLRSEMNEVNMTGTRPGSGRLGTSSSFGLEELGYPVDYRTHNIVLDGGYSTKTASFSANYTVSEFKNYNPSVMWPNFYQANATDTTFLPPSNLLEKFSLNGTLRNLPMSSTLAARATYSKLTDSFGVAQQGLLPNQASPSSTTAALLTPGQVGYETTAASASQFNGEHKTKTMSLSLLSNWTRSVDTRIYVDYYDKQNDSTPISYAASTGGAFAIAAVPAPTLFAFKKTDYGVDVGWRLTQGQKISGGYQYLKVHRERDDSEETRDTKYWAEYKNSMLDSLTGRIKTIFTERTGEYNPATPVAGTATPAQVPYYFRAYDVSSFTQPQVKVVLDWTPIRFLDVGFETAYKKTDYSDLAYGRKDDQRTEYNFTVAYGDPGSFRVTALANFEDVKFNQAYHQGTGPFPGGTQTAADFDWSTKNTQTNKLFGLIADWQAMSRLKLKGSYVWTKTGGGVDFTSGNTAGAGGFLGGPLVNYVTDNTTKQTLQLKGDYQVTKEWTGTVGFAYEKFDYTDDQMRGYQGYYPYYQNLNGQNQSWFSGAYANPSYKLTTIYMMAGYRFQ
jgi:hypothetical protein